MARASQTSKTVVYTVPGMETVTVRDLQYRVTDEGALTMELYQPPDGRGRCVPAVLSWARLVAATGLVSITYENREPGDVHHVLRYLRDNALTLGIDSQRLGVWACSGHGPNALSVLVESGTDDFACAVLLYSYTLDLDGATRVAEASQRFGFVTPAAGKTVQELPVGLPLFVARAGQDQMPGLNDALDAFVAAALSRNLPVTVVNHAAGPHAFDLFDDSRTSIETIKQVLAFLQFHLLR